MVGGKDKMADEELEFGTWTCSEEPGSSSVDLQCEHIEGTKMTLGGLRGGGDIQVSVEGDNRELKAKPVKRNTLFITPERK